MVEHETRRLRLIPFSLDMMRLSVADKNRLARMLGVSVPDSWPSPDFAEMLPLLIAEKEKHPATSPWDGLIIHKEDQKVIGDMGFKGPPDAARRVEIGYSIIPEYRNQGYATELSCHMIVRAWLQPGVTSVVAGHLDDHFGSVKVLEKPDFLRLSPEGHMRKWKIRRLR